jgi:Methyltransferase domain
MRLTPSAVLARAGRAVRPSGRGVVVPVSPKSPGSEGPARPRPDREPPAAPPAARRRSADAPPPPPPPPPGGRARRRAGFPRSRGVLDAYVRVAPSPQVAVDLFAGQWSSDLPDHLGVDAGQQLLFADPRIGWLLDQTDLKGASVLELGPLEGGHTFQLAAAGAEVTAIEAHTHAYLRCLVTKELLGASSGDGSGRGGGCRFLLGDFGAHLEAHPDERYDLVLASGVLHHSTDPLRLLGLMARASDRLALWCHYFDAEVVAATPALVRQFPGGPQLARLGGHQVRLHRRDYRAAVQAGGFRGGPDVHARWLERDDLLACLARLGYGDIRVGADDPWHADGPAILLYAERWE